MKFISSFCQVLKDNVLLFRDLFRRRLAIILFDRKTKIFKGEEGDGCGKRFLVVRWDAKLGDSIVCSWLYREIKKNNDKNQLIVIGNSNFKDLYESFWGGDVFYLKKRPSYRELRMLAEQMGQVDYTIHFGERLKMRDIYFLSRLSTSHIAGIDDGLNLIDIKLGERTYNKHFCEKFTTFLHLIGYQDIDSTYIIPRFPLVESEIRSQDWALESNTICFNPYGSGSSRKMDTEIIISVCDMMLRETNFSIIFLCMREQLKEVTGIISRTMAPERMFCLPSGSISIESLFSQLRMSIGLVSVDTATVHIASGLNLPTLAIYNSRNGEEDHNFLSWHPNNEKSIVLFTKDLDGRGVNSLSIDEFESRFKQWVKLFLS